MTQNSKFQTNTLYWYAEKYRKNITDEEEIEKIDMTEIFNQELEMMITNQEIIIININAKMRLGKSTLAMAIGKKVFELLKKHGYRKKGEKFGLRNIARDHQEHSKIMRNPKTQFTVIVTDEGNELENTGENVTVERALDKVFSDVQAGRYVHRVCCSPKETIDPNADILLSVISIDKKRYITHSKLFYRYYEGGMENTQLLGYVNTYVGDIVKNWDSIKHHFLKPRQTSEDLSIIEENRKKDWYTEYIIKKYEKMELITKEGIFKPRILDYAFIIINVIDKLKKLAKLTTIINTNIVRNYVKIEMSKNKIPMSIVGEELITREVMGILDLYKSYYIVCRKIEKLTTAKENKDKDIKIEQLKTLQQELINAIKIQENELIRYKEVNDKYHTKESE